MAIDAIEVDTTLRFGRLLVNISGALRQVREDVMEAEERMSHMRADNGTNGAPIAVAFGLTPQSSSVGEAAYAVITNALAALNDPAVITLIERVG